MELELSDFLSEELQRFCQNDDSEESGALDSLLLQARLASCLKRK